MNKTELFVDDILEDFSNGIEKYRKFIETHQNIEIVAVNVNKYDQVLLTYKE
ncbi:acetate CoA-transferase [Sporolactobacillus terrae]|uniref:acetate CoA-transferase n=1 Tax=Sporolactobacillus terrae TaxID=269673 RepID=UPI000ACC4BE6|nr:acetate CoA-transferase [Sporolactobacillus terrae]